MKTSYINLLLLVIGILPLPLMAQLDQGQLFITGSLTVNNDNYRNNQSDKTSSSNGFGVFLKGGYLIKNNLALTLGVNFGRSKNMGYNQIYTPVATDSFANQLYLLQYSDTKNRYNSLGFSLGLTRFVALKENLYLSLDGNLAASFGSTHNTEQIPGRPALINESKQHNFALNFNPGLIYFLSPRFGLSGNFGGLYLRFQPKSAGTSSSTLSGGFTSSGVLGIGLNYFIK